MVLNFDFLFRFFLFKSFIVVFVYKLGLKKVATFLQQRLKQFSLTICNMISDPLYTS